MESSQWKLESTSVDTYYNPEKNVPEKNENWQAFTLDCLKT
jgi:hypothetical protein